MSSTCITHGSASLSRMPGGVAFNLLQIREGAFMVIMEVKVGRSDGGVTGMPCTEGIPCDVLLTCLGCLHACATVERHSVAYLADFWMPTHPKNLGALVDNDKRIGVRLLDENDRTLQGARDIFDGLFWTAQSVRITSIWTIKKDE